MDLQVLAEIQVFPEDRCAPGDRAHPKDAPIVQEGRQDVGLGPIVSGRGRHLLAVAEPGALPVQTGLDDPCGDARGLLAQLLLELVVALVLRDDSLEWDLPVPSPDPFRLFADVQPVVAREPEFHLWPEAAEVLAHAAGLVRVAADERLCRRFVQALAARDLLKYGHAPRGLKHDLLGRVGLVLLRDQHGRGRGRGVGTEHV